jgi:glycosyltransferase involved in cell wall biosynthesis
VWSDHGQGRGIGGHGHWTSTERYVPCIWWGEGVPAAPRRDEVSVMDVAATLCHRAGARVPSRSVGRCLLCDGADHVGVSSDGPVVVVLPVHDEAATLAAVIERVPARVAGREVSLVVIDDGSTDGSGSVALAAGAKVVVHDRNLGLGAAVRTGLAEATALGAAAVAFLDADGEYDPAELEAVVAPVLRGEADYVVGSRFAGTIESMLWHRRVGNRMLTWLTSAMALRRLTDGQSGFRALSGWAAGHAVIAHDYNYAQVLTLRLLRQGFRYAEVPITYRRRRHGRSFVKVGRYLAHVLPAMVRSTRVR